MVVSSTRAVAREQWPVVSEMRSGGDRGDRNRQNEANLLLVLISGILRLKTNQAEIEQENDPNFRLAGWGQEKSVQ